MQYVCMLACIYDGIVCQSINQLIVLIVCTYVYVCYVHSVCVCVCVCVCMCACLCVGSYLIPTCTGVVSKYPHTLHVLYMCFICTYVCMRL